MERYCLIPVKSQIPEIVMTAPSKTLRTDPNTFSISSTTKNEDEAQRKLKVLWLERQALWQKQTCQAESFLSAVYAQWNYPLSPEYLGEKTMMPNYYLLHSWYIIHISLSLSFYHFFTSHLWIDNTIVFKPAGLVSHKRHNLCFKVFQIFCMHVKFIDVKVVFWMYVITLIEDETNWRSPLLKVYVGLATPWPALVLRSLTLLDD